MCRLLVIDTETGGLDPINHSILSLAGVVWEEGVSKKEIEVFVGEDPISVTSKAMEVNRIDLGAHGKRALPPEKATEAFINFVDAEFLFDLNRGEKIVLVGHNVAMDIGFLKRLLRLGNCSFNRYFSHRSLDTASILRYLVLCGRLPESVTSSDGAFAHFNIPFGEGRRHTALGDAIATAQLLTKLVDMLKS